MRLFRKYIKENNFKNYNLIFGLWTPSYIYMSFNFYTKKLDYIGQHKNSKRVGKWVYFIGKTYNRKFVKRNNEYYL